MEPRMGLPLTYAGVNVVSSTYTVEELLISKAKGEKKTENTDGEVIEAAKGKRLKGFVLLCLHNYGKCRGHISLATTDQTDTDQVDTSVVINIPTIV